MISPAFHHLPPPSTTFHQVGTMFYSLLLIVVALLYVFLFGYLYLSLLMLVSLQVGRVGCQSLAARCRSWAFQPRSRARVARPGLAAAL